MGGDAGGDQLFSLEINRRNFDKKSEGERISLGGCCHMKIRGGKEETE